MNIVFAKSITLLFIFIFLSVDTAGFCSANKSSDSKLCVESEKQALLSFKKGIVNDTNDELASWAAEQEDCCKWAGIVCNKIIGHVEELRLSGGAQFPKFICSLAGLRYLDLSGTNFSGMIPPHLGNLTKLRNLSLGFYAISPGRVYVENLLWLSGLSSLEYLDMSYVNLSRASDHWLLAINKLPSLRELYFYECELSHIHHLSYVNFTFLAILDLSYNNFNSLIPDWIFSLSNLVDLTLRSSNFIGPFPNGSWHLNSLTNLVASENHLNSTIPNYLYGLANLEYLDLYRNNLQGFISSAIGNLTSITFLGLSHNALEGELPMSLGNLRRMQAFNVAYNKVNGSFSKILASLPCVWLIDVSHNHLEGVISEAHFVNHTCLRRFSASGNLLRQRVSPDWIPPFDLLDLEMGSWNLGPQFPTWLRSQKLLTGVNLSNNGITGAVPRRIPDCWMKFPSLQVLDLGDNNLIGEIPSSVGSLKDLQWLRLHNNSLSGEIPSFLQNCTMLRNLDLGLNKFLGCIPTWLGFRLSNLNILNVRPNKLNGQIPHELCRLTKLQILDVPDNNLTGTIPSCFGNLIAMATKNQSSDPITYGWYIYELMENALVVIKGREDKYDTIHSLVTSLDLSSNNLSGEIPKQLTSLHGLISLNLSRNHLRGSIPDRIGDMESILSLDISRNQLSGKIPPSTSNLNFLSYFNMSCNELSGEIPLSTQLQSFGPSSFVGNQLCGPPLPEICIVDQNTMPAGTEDERKESDEDEEEYWFRLGIAVVFAVGFLGVISPLLFRGVLVVQDFGLLYQIQAHVGEELIFPISLLGALKLGSIAVGFAIGVSDVINK
ncbi:receptor-like protein EIX1 [Morus notabilis]|uniref:receptor-like protein EIX1 n=1 Tax=Morus notabilis TaxID=981085 RepID=UPI000CECE4C0|nr:receptor-like protein EIX1 [Morus notabilis]